MVTSELPGRLQHENGNNIDNKSRIFFTLGLLGIKKKLKKSRISKVYVTVIY